MEEPRIDLDPDDELRMAAIVKRILRGGYPKRGPEILNRAALFGNGMGG